MVSFKTLPKPVSWLGLFFCSYIKPALINFLYFLRNVSILFQKQLSQTDEWIPDFMGALGSVCKHEPKVNDCGNLITEEKWI